MKLSKKFKKEATEFRAMAEEHSNMDYAEIEKTIAKTLKAQDKEKKEKVVDAEKKEEKIEEKVKEIEAIEAVEPKKE